MSKHWQDIIIEAYPGATSASSLGDPVDITNLISNDWEFSTSSPGGDESLTLHRNDASPDPLFTSKPGSIIRAGTRITLRDSTIADRGIFWVGRVEVGGGDFSIRGGALAIVARGLASHGRAKHYDHSQKFVSDSNIVGVIADTLTDLCPLILDPGLKSDVGLYGSGRVLKEESPDYVLSDAQSIWNHMVNIPPLDGDALPMQWRVFNEDRFGTYYGVIPTFNLRERPAVGDARYVTRMKPGSGHRGGTILTASGDLQKIYNRVI